MFGQRSTTPAQQPPITTAPPSSSSSSLLQPISNRATGPALAPDSGYSTPSTSTAGALGNGPIHPSTNPASFRSLLGSHRAVVAMFTSATCPPCRMIEPVFEELARSKGQLQVAFVKVDLGVGMGSMVAREYGVAATPTFGFFLDGKKVRFGLRSRLFLWLIECLLARAQTHELKGVNALELRTQVDLLLYQAFPRKLIFWLCEQRAIYSPDTFLQLTRTSHWTSRLFPLFLPSPSCSRKSRPLTQCIRNSCPS